MPACFSHSACREQCGSQAQGRYFVRWALAMTQQALMAKKGAIHRSLLLVCASVLKQDQCAPDGPQTFTLSTESFPSASTWLIEGNAPAAILLSAAARHSE